MPVALALVAFPDIFERCIEGTGNLALNGTLEQFLSSMGGMMSMPKI